MNEKQPLPPNLTLSFKEGDLITKEGDYGLAIYSIQKGKVAITVQAGEKELHLTTLGPGEIIGEVTFLNREITPRAASARALEEVDVEVWHPLRLQNEYEQMEPIIRYISDQVLGRLLRMNRFIGRLGNKGLMQSVEAETAASQRSYYRKNLHTPCEYRPLDLRKSAWMKGEITDISLNGIGLEVNSKNNLQFPHENGKMFQVRATLPNRKEIQVDTKIVTIRKGSVPGHLNLGMAIVNMTEEAKKILGFFLMP